MWLRSLLFMLVLLVSACEEPKLPSPFHANDVTGKYAQANFKLIDHNGKMRTLADFRGKVVLMFFGYMHCPDVCPTTMADITLALRMLDKDDAAKVQVLFVTVDPERDTPALLAQYVPAFDASYLGLRGDVVVTAQVTQSFGVSYTKQASKTGYNVDHTAGVYIIDTNGKVRLVAPYGQRSEWLAQDIHLLLALH
jgi:protein SCO1/2